MHCKEHALTSIPVLLKRLRLTHLLYGSVKSRNGIHDFCIRAALQDTCSSAAGRMFKPPPPIPPGSLHLLDPQGIQWILGAELTPQQARLVHPVSHTTYYHMLQRERILARYHEYINYPCLFHHASPLPDGGLRMWFIMGHTPWDWQRHNCYVIWWCCDLRQAYIMRREIL